jgi:hypothetical protein
LREDSVTKQYLDYQPLCNAGCGKPCKQYARTAFAATCGDPTCIAMSRNAANEDRSRNVVLQMCMAGCGRVAAKSATNGARRGTCGDQACVTMRRNTASQADYSDDWDWGRLKAEPPPMHFEDAVVEEELITRHDRPSRSPGIVSSAGI